jgi:hypothetical protein
MYVFGGLLVNRENELWEYDLRELRWTCITESTGAPPAPRSDHSMDAVCHGKKLLICFGEGEPDNRPTNDKIVGLGRNRTKTASSRIDFFDMYTYDIEDNSWIALQLNGGLDEKGMHKPTPTSRRSHSTTLVKATETTPELVWLFGGAGSEVSLGYETTFNDIYALDTETMVWNDMRPMLSGAQLPHRSGHTCTQVERNLFIFGGVNSSYYGEQDLKQMFSVNMDTLVVKMTNLTGFITRLSNTLLGHSAFNYPYDLIGWKTYGKGIYIFGGRCEDPSPTAQANNEVMSIDTETGETRLVNMQGQKPAPRFEHQMVHLENYCIVFGGLDTRIGQGHVDENMKMLVFGAPTEVPESIQEKQRLEALRKKGQKKLQIKRTGGKGISAGALPLVVQMQETKIRQDRIRALLKPDGHGMTAAEELAQRQKDAKENIAKAKADSARKYAGATSKAKKKQAMKLQSMEASNDALMALLFHKHVHENKSGEDVEFVTGLGKKWRKKAHEKTNARKEVL